MWAVALVAMFLVYHGNRWYQSNIDLSEPPAVIDRVACARVDLNQRKIARGDTGLDTAGHRWALNACREEGFIGRAGTFLAR